MGGLSLLGLWLFLAAVLAGVVLLAVGSVWIANKTVYRPGAERQMGTLSPFLTTVALVYGALLGFTVVVAWEQFSSAEENVTNESSTLATMYRQTVSLPGPEQVRMRELLRTYTGAAQAEWDRQQRDVASSCGARGDHRHVPRIGSGRASRPPDQCRDARSAECLDIATKHESPGCEASDTGSAVERSAVRGGPSHRPHRLHSPE